MRNAVFAAAILCIFSQEAVAQQQPPSTQQEPQWTQSVRNIVSAVATLCNFSRGALAQQQPPSTQQPKCAHACADVSGKALCGLLGPSCLPPGITCLCPRGVGGVTR